MTIETTVTTEEKLSLTKDKFVDKLASDLGLTKKLAEQIYDLGFGYVRETLEANGRVRLPGVGVLFVDDIEAKEYPIPGTTQKVQKGARKRYKLNSKPFEA
jgi:nucleoid DNA-binding protein